MYKCLTLILFFCISILQSSCEKDNEDQLILSAVEKKEYEIAYRDKFYDVFLGDLENIWIVGQYGLILHSTDQGMSWHRQASKTNLDLFSVDFVDKDTGWITGAYGTILYTHDGGKNWQKQDGGTEKHLFDLDFIDQKNGWAVGYYGVILHTSDGGIHWENQTINEDINYNSISFVNSNEGWIGGEFGTILHTSTGGKKWIKQNSGINVTIFGIHFTDSSQGWAGGLLGTFLYTSDGGKSWKQVDSETENTLLRITANNNTIYTVGVKATLLKTPIGAVNENSEVIPVKSNQWLSGISFMNGKDRYGYIVGSHGTILYTEDGGVNWISKGLGL